MSDTKELPLVGAMCEGLEFRALCASLYFFLDATRTSEGVECLVCSLGISEEEVVGLAAAANKFGEKLNQAVDVAEAAPGTTIIGGEEHGE